MKVDESGWKWRSHVGPRQASKISPDHECFHQRGIVYHKTHDYRNGLADFRKARSSRKDTGFRNLHRSFWFS
jgi:hypothetical protein